MSQSNDSGLNLDHLEACPFCGSTNLSIETNSVQPDDFHDAWVNCDECNANGRHAMTLEGWLPSKAEAKEEAVVAWNRRAALANQPAPTVPAPVAAVRRWCKGDAEWTNWKFVDAAEYVRRKDDDAFQVVVLAHQPAQEQAEPSDASEGMELLDTLTANIAEGGNYSAEATLLFLSQIRQCFASPAAQQDPVAAPDRKLDGEAMRAIRRAVRYLEENDCTGPAEDLKALLDPLAAAQLDGGQEGSDHA